MESKTWKKVAGFAAAGSLAALLAFGALAPQTTFAQDTPTGTPTGASTERTPGAWAAALAERLGVTEAEVQAAVDAVAAQIADEAVAQEVMTEAEADEILAALATLVTDGVQGSGTALREIASAAQAIDFDAQAALAEALGVDVDDLGGGLLLGGRGRMDGPRGFERGAGMQIAPEGLSEEEQAAITARREAVEALQPYLEGETFQNAITSAYQTAIDEAVADGALTEEQAATLLEQGVFPGFGMILGDHGGFGGRAGMPGFFGPRGDAPAPDSADE